MLFYSVAISLMEFLDSFFNSWYLKITMECDFICDEIVGSVADNTILVT